MTPMKIGIICYASVGGSGVVATELAHALALRGHEVFLVSSELPFRWRSGVAGLTFEQVVTPPYPLFREPQYLLALTNTLVRVTTKHRLDILHAHYAVPHATAAYLAQQILTREETPMMPGPSTSLGTGPSTSLGAGPFDSLRSLRAGPRTVTTLHGTDITLVGSDPSYACVVAFSIERSNGVTAVSRSLRDDTLSSLGIRNDIRVIPNFLDCAEYRRRPDPAFRERWCPAGTCDAVVLHVSNFRPVKRVGMVLEIFRRVRRHVRARLVLIGDGPDREPIERLVEEHGLTDVVDFVGEQFDLVPWLSIADLFLLPSQQESFGMAALEAMACEVAVVASRVGGLPEIIEDGVTGFVCPPDDLDAMVERSLSVLTDPERGSRIGRAAAAYVRAHYCMEAIVPQYESYYREVLARG